MTRRAARRGARGRAALAAIAAIALLGAAPAAIAQVGCNVTAAPLDFGVYDTLGPGANVVNGGITLDCFLTNPPAAHRISYTISLGSGSSGSYGARTLRKAAGGEALRYNAYHRVVSPGSVWGDGTAGTTRAAGAITVNKNTRPLTLPMIGVIPARQAVGAGLYTDIMTVTVVWN